jgi:hypothetical protein
MQKEKILRICSQGLQFWGKVELNAAEEAWFILHLPGAQAVCHAVQGKSAARISEEHGLDPTEGKFS